MFPLRGQGLKKRFLFSPKKDMPYFENMAYQRPKSKKLRTNKQLIFHTSYFIFSKKCIKNTKG